MKVWSLGLVGLAWCCCIDAPVTAKPLWNTYHYSVHGCSLEYPQSVFRRQPFDVSQQGQRFSSADKSIYFRVLGFQNEDQLTSAAIKAKYFAASVPGDVVYERQKPNFWVASGYRGKEIFYTKVALSRDRHTACVLEIAYPRRKKAVLDDLVTRMSHSFSTRP
jgi:hypothetical protein